MDAILSNNMDPQIKNTWVFLGKNIDFPFDCNWKTLFFFVTLVTNCAHHFRNFYSLIIFLSIKC